MIADRIRAHVRTNCNEETVADVRIGLGYTAVLLNDGRAGVAYTFKEGLAEGCSVFQGTRPLAGRSSHELMAYLGSANLVESSVGLAAVNALVNQKAEIEGDILESLDLKKEDRVGMVGFFGPLVPSLKKKVNELLIFEESTSRGEGLLPAEQAQERLPECDVALITSTSLINGTIDALLAATEKCRETALLGASTPLIPEVFQDFKVTLLSGVVVIDPTGIAAVVSEGGGMKFFKGLVTKTNVWVKNH
jgi:hypothetical protein